MKLFDILNSLFIKTAHAAETATIDPGFAIPSLTTVLGFLIKTFFIIAGLASLIFLLLGALSWITSGGDKEGVKKAQEKIQAALIGLIVIVALLAILVTIELVIFGGKICFGLTCPINFDTILQSR